MEQPFEILLAWSLLLPLQTILNLSLTCRYYYEVINQNQNYWRFKSEEMFGSVLAENWKHHCFNHGRIHQYRDEEEIIIRGLRAQQISSSSDHTLAVDFQGKIWSWDPQHLTPVHFMKFPKSVKQVAAEKETSYLLTQSGDLYYVGKDIGEPGITYKLTRIDFPVIIVKFSVSGPTLFALDNLGRVWCYGRYNSDLHCLQPMLILIRGMAQGISTSRYRHALFTKKKIYMVRSRHGDTRELPHDTPGIKQIVFGSSLTLVLYNDGRYEFYHYWGVTIKSGKGGSRICGAGDSFFVFNSQNEVICSRGIKRQLPLAFQINVLWNKQYDLLEQ